MLSTSGQSESSNNNYIPLHLSEWNFKYIRREKFFSYSAALCNKAESDLERM